MNIKQIRLLLLLLFIIPNTFAQLDFLGRKKFTAAMERILKGRELNGEPADFNF